MSERTRLGVGDAAPVIDLTDTDGQRVGVDPAVSNATVLVFTSNGCPYALAWHDRIQDVVRDYAEQGVSVVQVICNDDQLQPLDSAENMDARVQRGEVAGVFLRDGDQSTTRLFGATATPETFVIDRQGVVRYHGAPDRDYDDPGLRAEWLREGIEAVLESRNPAQASTPPAGCSVKWRVELLWWAGCPSHDRAEELIREQLADMHREDVRVERIEVTSAAQAAAYDFPGSPTIRIGGTDLFPQPGATPALACRAYTREDGQISPLPSRAELDGRMREALVRPWELPNWVDFRKQAATS
ncbi:redoxin family protein [Marmoricola sp. URHB0036]|uniref:redoxin family protein n=1 Tax=Marmoricola sp. URHB0036 TaxID=1298863 RepID=UPI000428F69E|nr:redoxin family protein [Marmoricola sp. URHB0036]